ncbi:hypothetical protein [Clostridium sp.]|uniref:hypothetical protein n=1 Tax=Clostridium sp. TaxID=1506 RepID=UPI0032166AF3
MSFLGGFWGIVSIILMIGALSRMVGVGFYNKFIRGLSKKKHKGLINATINTNNILEDNHGIFASGALISAVIHIIIMKRSITFSFLGFSTIGALLFVVLTGVINKFIYRDNGGELRKYHKRGIIVLIFFLILHMIFN